MINSETVASFATSAEYEHVLQRFTQGLAESVKKFSSQGNRVGTEAGLALSCGGLSTFTLVGCCLNRHFSADLGSCQGCAWKAEAGGERGIGLLAAGV